MIPILVALFVLYVVATLWQARRTLVTRSPEARLRQARTLLLVVSLGVPLLVVLILVAF